LDIRIRLQADYPAGYPTGKPDSDHLWRLQWQHRPSLNVVTAAAQRETEVAIHTLSN